MSQLDAQPDRMTCSGSDESQEGSFPQDLPRDFRGYRLYGMRVLSQYPLSEHGIRQLPGAGCSDDASPRQHPHPPDITITYRGIVPRETDDPAKADPPPDALGRVWADTGSHRMLRFYGRYGHTIDFLIDPDGSGIQVSQSWPEWRDTFFGLANGAITAALHLKGFRALHASSLIANSHSYLVMGVSGAGKSSLSAALAAEGMAMHSDDIAIPMEAGTVAMNINGTPRPWEGHAPPHIAAGYGRIKISPMLAETLGLPGDELVPVQARRSDNVLPRKTGIASHPPENHVADTEEDTDSANTELWVSAHLLPGDFHPDPAPLGAILVLGNRRTGLSHPVIEPLQGMPAVIALSNHFYGRDWLQPPSPQDPEFCRRLAEHVPVYRITMPDDLSLLRASARHIMTRVMEPSRPESPS
ncbi:hypothetical protein QA596_02480 [Balneolales bacterium ANBcel1]|nr:hypothetical protein [Balneolales bacterium ANBcel1]